MQFQYALFALFAFLANPKPIACYMESEILAFLDAFKARMCHPIPNLGLPALDPLQITHKELAADTKYFVNFTGSIDDFMLTGLSDFVVNELVINLYSVTGRRSIIDISFPYTALKSIYTAKGSLAYILNLAGDGIGEAIFTEFRFIISWRMKFGLPLGITNLQFEMYLDNLHINFENLLEEERVNDFFHDLINELGLELLDDIWTYEQESVQQVMEDYINASVNDLIKLVVGGGNGESSPIFDGVPGDCKDQGDITTIEPNQD